MLCIYKKIFFMPPTICSMLYMRFGEKISQIKRKNPFMHYSIYIYRVIYRE